MKLAFVIQRYGADIAGGAEDHCRRVCEALVEEGHAVHVYTTCAYDYITWDDVYEPGIETINGVVVHRYRVDEPRSTFTFNLISKRVFAHPGNRLLEQAWMRAQGPYSTALQQALKQDSDEYDWWLFFTYLYATTYYGLPLCASRAILVPLAHDEPPLRLHLYNETFRTARGIIFNTNEEQTLLGERFPIAEKPQVRAGMWPIAPVTSDPHPATPQRFILYVGRIDPSKGCIELMQYFAQYKDAHPSELQLVMVGPGTVPMPDRTDIVALGQVTEPQKWALLRAAAFVCIPSPYESLSLALLEAFSVSKPVLVNGNCAVTVDHCRTSNAGLWYTSAEEFSAAIEYLQTDPALCQRMGELGHAYVTQHYTREKVLAAYETLFAMLREESMRASRS